MGRVYVHQKTVDNHLHKGFFMKFIYTVLLLSCLSFSIRAMETDMRCRHSFELTCCSLLATLAGSGLATEGFVQRYFPFSNATDRYMGEWSLSSAHKVEVGAFGALCGSLCLEESDHSCIWGHCFNCLQGLSRRLRRSMSKFDKSFDKKTV